MEGDGMKEEQPKPRTAAAFTALLNISTISMLSFAMQGVKPKITLDGIELQVASCMFLAIMRPKDSNPDAFEELCDDILEEYTDKKEGKNPTKVDFYAAE